MLSLFLGGLLIIAAIVIPFVTPANFPRSAIAGVLFLLGGVAGVSGSVSYNDAGYCSHIRTAFGSESSKCDVGWYFSGWGTSVQWPLYISVQNSPREGNEISNDAAQFPVYSIRLADNWTGDITQTTRFGIPQNEEQFLKLAHDFRTPQNLISNVLVPTVNAALDTTANLFTMEEYYAGGARDAFKKEFADTMILGPAITEKIDDPQEIQKRVSANPANAATEDTNEAAASGADIQIVEKKRDKSGSDIRPNKNQYSAYGIVVNSAIVSNLDPDTRYEEQIKLRKEAISRRVIAKDQRLEQEEQRFLTIAKSETEIAQRQGEARVKQIEQTTGAETEKKLALIKAQQQTEQAAIEKKTAEIAFETAKIAANSKIVTAEADAKARELAIAADNALQSKIDAEIAIQTVWADAYAKRQVPQIVFGGGAGATGAPTGSDSEVQTFFNLMNANAAKNLSYDRTVEPVGK